MAEMANKIKEAFRNYDTEGVGSIDKQQLKLVIQRLCGLSIENIDQMFSQMDSNKDGAIQFEEFIDWLADDTKGFLDVVDGDDPMMGKVQAALRACLQGGSVAIALEDLGVDIMLDGNEPQIEDVLAAFEGMSTKKLRETFESADLDRNKSLQLGELQRLLFPSATTDESAMVVAKVFALMDKNRDGKISCAEFTSYMLAWKKHLAPVATAAERKRIAATFRAGDVDSSGGLSIDELEQMLQCTTPSEKQIVEVCFDRLDKDGDGNVSLKEFCALFGKNLMKEAKGIEVEWNPQADEPDSGPDDP